MNGIVRMGPSVHLWGMGETKPDPVGFVHERNASGYEIEGVMLRLGAPYHLRAVDAFAAERAARANAKLVIEIDGEARAEIAADAIPQHGIYLVDPHLSCGERMRVRLVGAGGGMRAVVTMVVRRAVPTGEHVTKSGHAGGPPCPQATLTPPAGS